MWLVSRVGAYMLEEWPVGAIQRRRLCWCEISASMVGTPDASQHLSGGDFGDH